MFLAHRPSAREIEEFIKQSIFPTSASIQPGTTAAVLIHHLWFWSLNGCRVVYELGDRPDDTSFGFAYGTLTIQSPAGCKRAFVESPSVPCGER